MVGAYANGPGGNLVFNMDVAPPPADVIETISAVGSVNPKSGVATVTYTVSTSSPIFVYWVDVFAKQRSGRGNVLGFTSDFIYGDLDTSFTRSVSLQDPYGGLFVAGKANVSVSVYYFDYATGFYYYETTEQAVQLKGKR